MAGQDRRCFASARNSDAAISGHQTERQLMAENEIRHVGLLPFGYSVTFTWSREAGPNVEWKPAAPVIRSPRARRKFRDAYNTIRRSFYEDVATCAGGAVIVNDIDGPTETILPASKH